MRKNNIKIIVLLFFIIISISNVIHAVYVEDYYWKEKSENAFLESIYLDVMNLTPEFNKNITEYIISVDSSVNDINVVAVPEDTTAKVTVEGNRDLVEGENVIEITVTAEAGNTLTYTINVIKVKSIDQLNTNLKTLTVINYEIYPTFKPNIYNYNVIINSIIDEIEIKAETENENAIVHISGNKNLKEGDNLVKIIVIAEDRSDNKGV